MYSEWRPVPVAFMPMLTIDTSYIPESAHILVRLKEGVSMERFLHDFRPWMVKEMRRGNLFARSVRSYEQIITESEASNSTPIYRRNLAMAAFFLVNLCLGVIGTFWLQTRTRREEVGVMLSFGATRSDIVRLLMGEGTVLTVVASLTGFLLYLQYALKEGLAKGQNWVESTESYWVSDFTSHYLLVSLVIFLILLVVVLVGIYIPARNISRIPPTEALRDECADILLYLLLIADKAGIDLAAAAREKLAKNAAKYPVDKAYGSRAKYTELGQAGFDSHR